MNRKFSIVLVAVGVLVLGAAVTDVKAQCPATDTKIFNTAFGGPNADQNSFIVFPADADLDIEGTNLKARFWQAGNRAAANEGTECHQRTYLVLGENAGEIAVFGQMGGDILGTGACLNGGACPVGALVLLIQTRSNDGARSYFAVGRVNETPGAFDFSSIEPNTNWTVIGSPRARVTTSSRNGGNVTVNIHFDAPTTYAHAPTGIPKEGIITGYQVFRVNSNTDPGRSPAAWGAPIQTIPTTATGADLNGLVVDCSGVTTDVFLGTRAVFDGGQFTADDISEATRIECDPTVAEPRFNQIEKKRPTSPRTPPARQ